MSGLRRTFLILLQFFQSPERYNSTARYQFYTNRNGMRMLLTLLLVSLILVSCQTGRIPCPTFKTARLSKSNPGQKSFAPTFARAEKEPTSNKEAKTGRISASRFVGNVTEDEWDCPEPGSKKYLPRRVKENIRRNFQKIHQDDLRARQDSLASR